MRRHFIQFRLLLKVVFNKMNSFCDAFKVCHDGTKINYWQGMDYPIVAEIL